jgi:tetratricopeptide (TPR) repeat protein
MGADGAGTNLGASQSCDVFLLPGLNAERVSFNIGSLNVRKLSVDEFDLLEKNQFLDDMWEAYEDGKTPFFAVFTGAHISRRKRDLRRESRHQDVRRLARACWLYAPDILYDPSEHIRYERDGTISARVPNLCGRAMIGSYCARCLASVDIAVIDRMFARLAIFDSQSRSNQVSFAEIQFSKVFKYTILDMEHQYFLLLSSLMLLLADNKKAFKNFADKEPFKAIDLEMITNSRNAIAHGTKRADQALITELGALVRLLLRHAIAWALEQPGLQSFSGVDLLRRVVTNCDDLKNETSDSDIKGLPAPASNAPPSATGGAQDDRSVADDAFTMLELVGKFPIRENQLEQIERNLSRMGFEPEENFPEFTDYHALPVDIAKAWNSYQSAMSRIERRKFDLAEKDLTSCISEIEEDNTSGGDKARVDQSHKGLLFLAYFARGDILDERAKYDEAAKEMRIADDIFNALPNDYKSALESFRVKFLCNFAMVLSKTKDPQGALERAQGAYKLIQELVERDRREYLPLLPVALNCLAVRQSQAGMPREALLTARVNLEVTRGLFEKDHRQFAIDYHAALHTLGRWYEDCGDDLKAKFFLREASRRVLRVVSDD